MNSDVANNKFFLVEFTKRDINSIWQAEKHKRIFTELGFVVDSKEKCQVGY